MIKITVYYVNGKMSEWDEPNSIIKNLYNIEQSGLSGKSLINSLITDDWGCPPKFVSIKGIYENKEFKKVISYE